ncbi:MAG TPA: glutathione S-transferase C-terminal domain-containing protein, partial [Gammaproteobacteria bacterium]|nr:glutathione S-transferase C-terminal domain-containing protein [Gammaproteobacteria bacterium]
VPGDAAGEARVMQWLAVSGNELLYGLARARAVHRLGRPFDLEQCQHDAHAGLRVMESRLSEAPWLAGGQPTIADVACYPYVSLADEADVALSDYPAVRDWLQRLAQLPGWVAMDA